MITHLTVEKAFGITSEDLAEKIGDLRYDELALFFRNLSRKLSKDSAADRGRNRRKLASELSAIAMHVHSADVHTRIAWTISEPHMK